MHGDWQRGVIPDVIRSSYNSENYDERLAEDKIPLNRPLLFIPFAWVRMVQKKNYRNLEMGWDQEVESGRTTSESLF